LMKECVKSVFIRFDSIARLDCLAVTLQSIRVSVRVSVIVRVIVRRLLSD